MAKRFDVVDVTEPEVVENEAGDKVVVLSNVRFRVKATQEELKYPTLPGHESGQGGRCHHGNEAGTGMLRVSMPHLPRGRKCLG